MDMQDRERAPRVVGPSPVRPGLWEPCRYWARGLSPETSTSLALPPPVAGGEDAVEARPQAVVRQLNHGHAGGVSGPGAPSCRTTVFAGNEAEGDSLAIRPAREVGDNRQCHVGLNVGAAQLDVAVGGLAIGAGRPVAPVAPVAPSAPSAPSAPVGPVGPRAPVSPLAPAAPSEPSEPAGPRWPAVPWAPCSPAGPAAPGGPC